MSQKHQAVSVGEITSLRERQRETERLADRKTQRQAERQDQRGRDGRTETDER